MESKSFPPQPPAGRSLGDTKSLAPTWGVLLHAEPAAAVWYLLATRETAKQPTTPGVAALSIHEQGYTTDLREELDLHFIHGVTWIDLPDAGEEGQDGAANRGCSAQSGPG